MKVAQVPIASFDDGSYRCRFCSRKVSEKDRVCSNCGIPYPSQEAMGQRFIYRLVAAAVLFGGGGWLVGFLRGSWLLQVLGALAGIVVGLLVFRRFAGHGEVRVRTHAFLRLNPEAIDWPPADIAAELGTPGVAVVARALEQARRRR